ncbi:uncharacterized protein LOC121420711 [Lytechinus variegatus]|uniref:uncharacterized protein LOC121420711 n=1 Tax=Lytechinus variegatus TaxID=7654 RepID=UPI001BB1AB68|nr:uncharacterized protein LOC121420711 [Lytechinus variegatus]
MTETLTEEKVFELAEAVAVDKNLLILGLKLGFKEPKVKMYISTNKRNESSEGTSSMLFDWKRKTPRAQQIPDLIKALNESGFAELVDDFFPSGLAGGVATHAVSAVNPSTAASNTDNAHVSTERLVTDGEITRLASRLPYGRYSQLCEELGFHYNSAQSILVKHQRDSTAAFKEVLQEWKDKGGFMVDLDTALKNSDLGGLIHVYKK